MNLERLKELIIQAWTFDPASQEWEKVMGEIATMVLLTNRITRPLPVNPTLSDIGRVVCADAHEPLKHRISRFLEGSYLQDYKNDLSGERLSKIQDRLYEFRDTVLKKVLTHKHFDAMAEEAKRAKLHLQQVTSEVERQQAVKIWQAAIGMLYESTLLANRFTRSHQGGSPILYNQIHKEAFNKAWEEACKRIERYDPTRQHFLTWFNYVLDRRILDAFNECPDPLVRKLKAWAKRQLRALKKTVHFGLTLNAWCKPSETTFKAGIYCLVLLLLRVETRFYQVDPGDYEPPYDDSNLLNNPAKAFLERVERDSDGRYQAAHLRGRPDVNFRSVLPLFVAGRSWDEISEIFSEQPDRLVRPDTIRIRFHAWLKRFWSDFEELF